VGRDRHSGSMHVFASAATCSKSSGGNLPSRSGSASSSMRDLSVSSGRACQQYQTLKSGLSDLQSTLFTEMLEYPADLATLSSTAAHYPHTFKRCHKEKVENPGGKIEEVAEHV